MATIRQIQARTIRVPLTTPVQFATRAVAGREYVAVRLQTDDGVEGIGFCYAGNFGGRVVAAAVEDLIAPLYVGGNQHSVRRLWDVTYRHTLLHGRAGSVMRALSAVDIALWDTNARAAGLPLYEYLGAARDEAVPAYASGGYYVDGKDTAALAGEATAYVKAGFDAVKIKVGRASIGEDAERIAAVREVVGPSGIVMLDANNAWDDLPSALRAMDAWMPSDPYWIEEPFSPDDIRNHARLAQQIDCIVATGEIEAGRWRHQQLLEAGAAEILQTDAAVCGGISEFLQIASAAAAHGVTLCPHWFHDLHVHLVAAIPNGRYVEFFPDSSVLNFRELIDTQLDVLDGGRLRLPVGPGLGFGFDPDALERFAAEPWRTSDEPAGAT